jgi:ABC-type multidrug transport system ATPase subunit/pSer/pThr/pTyr-binding forkhead associated (FHA) protein/ABC-type multidrug transport system permease subunit
MTDDFDITLGAKHQAADEVVLKGARDDVADDVHLRESALLHAGRRIPIPRSGITIGRGPQCDLTLQSGLVSTVHARIEERGGGQVLIDLASSTGTYLDGEHFRNAARPLHGGDSIAIGSEIMHFVTTRDTQLPPIEVGPPASSLRMDKPRLTLGRDTSNDVVLDHPNVSPQHAEIVVGNNGARLKDLSSGGTGCRVNGRLVSRCFLKTGDELGIGPFRLVFDGELLQQRSQQVGLRLGAEGVCFQVGSKTILQPCTLTVKPGELVAIIGESGAGKSTLIKVMCGVHRASGGRVLVNGEPVGTRLTDIGYVPQDEIVHSLLTVREALAYAAELRLPQDAPVADRDAAIVRVIEEVGLSEHADTRIGRLSGGQRKRTGVASELISQPGLLFLDEPTTGLDPGLEARMMRLFRSLADAGRPVVLVTHATRSLSLCDKVVVMGRGGLLCFDGSPASALEFFGVEYFDDLYVALEDQGAQTWHARFAARSGDEQSNPASQSRPARAAPPRLVGPQTWTLTRRYAKLMRRDGRNLKVLALQVPLLALATALLFRRDVFVDQPISTDELAAQMFAGESAQVLFLLVTIAIWFGAICAAREIIKERTVVARELSVGLRLPAYIASKAIVLFALAGAQTICLTVIVVSLRPLHSEGAGVTLALLLVVTAWVGVAMGLLVSAWVHSEDQAASFIPLILVPQLLFGGAIVPTDQMPAVMQLISRTFVSQWAFAGVGRVIDLNARIDADPQFNQASRYGENFFGVIPPVTLLVLLAFLAIFGLALYRRLPAFARTT